MISLSTKFEVSMFTHYEDTKGNVKCRNWVVWGWSFDTAHMISYFLNHVSLIY